mgnify:CR=1 FL=1
MYVFNIDIANYINKDEYTKIIKELLEAGADINIKNK